MPTVTCPHCRTGLNLPDDPTLFEVRCFACDGVFDVSAQRPERPTGRPAGRPVGRPVGRPAADAPPPPNRKSSGKWKFAAVGVLVAACAAAGALFAPPRPSETAAAAPAPGPQAHPVIAPETNKVPAPPENLPTGTRIGAKPPRGGNRDRSAFALGHLSRRDATLPLAKNTGKPGEFIRLADPERSPTAFRWDDLDLDFEVTADGHRFDPQHDVLVIDTGDQAFEVAFAGRLGEFGSLHLTQVVPEKARKVQAWVVRTENPTAPPSRQKRYRISNAVDIVPENSEPAP